MILAGTGIIDSFRGASLPAEIVVGTGSTVANKIIYSSSDAGTSWARYSGNLNTNATIYDVIYANNIWVAVGFWLTLVSPNYYNIAYSTDGINWTPVNPTPNFINLHKVRYGGGKFLANGTALTYYYSSVDGINWTQELGLSSLLIIYSTVYFNGNWYASGLDGSSSKIYRSADGVSWSLVFTYPAGSPALTALATNGTILTVQASNYEAWWSNNGTTWTKGTTSTGQGTLLDLAVANCIWCPWPISKFVLGGFRGSNTGTKMRASSDGKNWTSVDTSAILGTTTNSSVYISGLNFDSSTSTLWLTRAQSGPAGFTGVVFKTFNLSSFTTVVTNTTISSLGYNVFSIATKQ